MCVLHGTKVLIDKSSLRPRVNVKAMFHGVDLEELTFVYLDLIEDYRSICCESIKHTRLLF